MNAPAKKLTEQFEVSGKVFETNKKYANDVWSYCLETYPAKELAFLSYKKRLIMDLLYSSFAFFLYGGTISSPISDLKVKPFVKTYDLHRKGRFEFPRLNYLFKLASALPRKKRIVIVKSRQIMISWLMCAFYLWLGIKKEGRFYFVSKKERDAHENIERVGILYDSLPEWVQSYHPADVSGRELYSKYGHFFLTDQEGYRSVRMIAVPQGSDQLRQYASEGVFIDEGREQDELDDMIQAVAPGTWSAHAEGGRIDVVSSPGRGPFKDLVFDEITDSEDINDERFPWEPLTDDAEKAKHFKYKDNELDSFRVFYVSYKIDPNKDTEEFKERAKKDIREDWRWEREMELSFRSVVGDKVFADMLNPRIHKVLPDSIPSEGTVYMGIDWGYKHYTACVFLLVGPDNNVYVIDEYYDNEKTPEQHVEPILRKLDRIREYEKAKYGHGSIDHSTDNNDGRTSIYAKLRRSIPNLHLAKKGRKVKRGLTNAEMEIINALGRSKDIQTDPSIQKGRGLYISSKCKRLWWELEEREYKEPTGNSEISETPVDANNDCTDALGYILMDEPQYTPIRTRRKRNLSKAGGAP